MRRVLAVGIGALSVMVGAGTARADVLQDLGATFVRVAQELRDRFPKVDASIVAVEGAEVRIAGPGVGVLWPGFELVAYRKGEVFRHPLTNQPLGQAEEEVATLTVVAVAGDEAITRIAGPDGGRAPVVGDRARMTAGRIPVAVLPPLGVNVPGETADQTGLLLVSRFSALLEKTGRFLAIEPERVVEVAAPPVGPAPDPLEVARRLRASGVLASRIVQEGQARWLEVTWTSGRTGTVLETRRTPLVRAAFPPRFAWEQTPELERRHALEGPVRGLAVADVDGDGRPELVVGDDRGVVVYRWQEGAGLVPLPGAEFRPGGEILSVDAADVNGTGRAQIVVVDSRGTSEVVRSTVLEWAGDRLRPLYEVGRHYLRVISVGPEPWLLEQRIGASEPFEPTIRRLQWEGGRYREGPTLRVPAGVTVYGLGLLRLTGSPEPEIVALTPENRLAVWTARGRRLWTSADSYGGPVVTFAVAAAAARDGEPMIGRILGRLIVFPDGREGPEVLVFENLLPVGSRVQTLLPRLVPLFFNQGRIHRLRWKDGGFLRVWQSRVTEGYIADFGLGDVDGDGVPEVVVGVVQRNVNLDTLNPFGRSKAHLVFYELP